MFYQALLQRCIIKIDAAMSEQTEKLVKIILPDLLNYLETVESGEIIEKRLEKNVPHYLRKEKDEKFKEGNKISNK